MKHAVKRPGGGGCTIPFRLSGIHSLSKCTGSADKFSATRKYLLKPDAGNVKPLIKYER